MRVRLLTSIASAAWSYAPGDVADVDDIEAQSWIVAGIAVPVEVDGEPEAEIVEPPETATAEPQRSRRQRLRRE